MSGQVAAWLAERLLNAVPAGIVVAFAAWVLLRLLARNNSSVRFAAWFSALLAIGALPFVGSFNGERAGIGKPAVFTVPSLWGNVLLVIWAVIAAAAFLRITLSLYRLLKLRAGQKPVAPADLHPILQQTLSEFCASRKVTVAISDEVRVPAAIGFLKPMIVLPKWAVAELPPEQLNAILIHELAHLERWDDCTNLAQKIISAFFFFNPAIIWIERTLSMEREIACDDAVLARTADPRAYAKCLVAVAERSFVRRGMALAQAAVGRMRQTSRRVTRILDSHRPHTIRSWGVVFALVTAFSVTVIGGLSRAPELIAFQQPAASPLATRLPVASLEKPSEALVIPTSFNPTTMETAMAKTPRKLARSRAAGPMPFESRVEPMPMLVRASAFAEGQFATQTVLVIMQSGGAYSSRSWTVCVWRVTFVNRHHIPLEARQAAKST